MTPRKFNDTIREYYEKSGRHNMPWRKTRDPYRILISEVMLQQTQAARVEAFYKNFIKKFPNFPTLAEAKTSDILKAWQGLGYNRRALLLQRLSKIVLERFNGKLPQDREQLEDLPGIGRGTSGSLMAFAFNLPEIFIETNIRRVFIHHFFPKKKIVTDLEIERCIERTINTENPREWYLAIMDYGSQLEKNKNPNRRSAHYAKQSTFKGSNRELRGRVIKLFLEKKTKTLKDITKELSEPFARVKEILAGLARDGFVRVTKGDIYCINN